MRCHLQPGRSRGETRAQAYDVVVTDLVMDGRRDGLEVLQRAKPAATAAAGDSGDGSRRHADDLQGGDERGAYDFIEKPLDLEDFRAQVNRAAEQAALQRQNAVLEHRYRNSSTRRVRGDHRQQPGDAEGRADCPAGGADAIFPC